MKITLESTDKIVQLNGVPARIWQGQTESGIPCHAFVTRIAVDKSMGTSRFDHELTLTVAPRSELEAYPLRMLL